MFTLKITNGKFILEGDVNKPPVDCKPNKTANAVLNQLLASSHGIRDSEVLVNGKPVKVNFNLTIAK